MTFKCELFRQTFAVGDNKYRVVVNEHFPGGERPYCVVKVLFLGTQFKLRTCSGFMSFDLRSRGKVLTEFKEHDLKPFLELVYNEYRGLTRGNGFYLNDKVTTDMLVGCDKLFQH